LHGLFDAYLHAEITTLDRPTLMELVESVKISEGVGDDGKRKVEITIHYRFIGNLLQNAKKDAA
jgi:hypothetical protein